jgi:hypothetical protein
MTVAGGPAGTLRDVPEPLLASDADRDIALALLREAAVDGRLTIEDLAERAELVHAARTRDDVAAATAGLAPAAVVELTELRHRAWLSTVIREGRWTLAPRNRFTAVLGTVRLDLREAVLSGPEVQIDAVPILGTVEILVPEGVHVEVTGGGLLSTQQLRLPGPAPDGAPVVRIHAGGALGTLKVRCKPRLVDQLKDTARRLANRLGSPPPRAG